jgi:hypothetical protein
MGNVSHKFPRLGWASFRRSAAPNYGLLMTAILQSLPLYARISVATTPLTALPNDPAGD